MKPPRSAKYHSCLIQYAKLAKSNEAISRNSAVDTDDTIAYVKFDVTFFEAPRTTLQIACQLMEFISLSDCTLANF